MVRPIRQQIVISGVGGQGVLFITRLLAEAAIIKGLAVFTSETHGMAQRGGTVLSHLKVGDYSSPLIRPFRADGILALQPSSLSQHGSYLKPSAWVVVNSPGAIALGSDWSIFTVDADRLALKINNPKAVNLVLLGFAMAAIAERSEGGLFCSLGDIKSVLRQWLAGKQQMMKASILAIETGYGSP